jgi:integrase
MRTFFAWCHRTGIIDADPTTELRDLLKQFPQLYGKVQAKNPGRFLTHDEAFGMLVAKTQDGSLLGLRDEIGIRLGLTGMRLSEIIGLTWNAVRLTTLPPEIHWIGKGRRARHIVPGIALLDALDRWRRLYRDGLQRDPQPTDPILCRVVRGSASHRKPHRIDWTEPLDGRSYYQMVQVRARSAGLGHVAPHDLRRSAAAILHHAKTKEGGHLFDLLDVQKVLGHADPATTMRSYLDPLDAEVQDRAASFLD